MNHLSLLRHQYFASCESKSNEFSTTEFGCIDMANNRGSSCIIVIGDRLEGGIHDLLTPTFSIACGTAPRCNVKVNHDMLTPKRI